MEDEDWDMWGTYGYWTDSNHWDTWDMDGSDNKKDNDTWDMEMMDNDW